jgi:pyridoxine 5-phosphate synthase
MERVRGVVSRLKDHGIRVSLFIDPLREQIEAAKQAGADTIEIHTGAFANARTEEEHRTRLDTVRESSRLARGLGLGVNAGHGLNYLNLIPFRTLADIEEVSIGHAVIVRALFVGLDRAVKEMLALVR